MKRFLVLILILGAIVVAGYFSFRPQATPLKYSGPAQKIRVGNVGAYSILNLIARDKSFFANYGLDAEIVEYDSGPTAMVDLIADKLDLTIAAEFVGVRNIFDHPDVRILSEVSKQQAFSVVARKGSGIAKPEDLKGKTIGVTRKGAGEYFLGQFLVLNNLKLSDITISDLTPVKMSEGIEDGTLDAVVIFDPHAYNLKKKFGDEVLVWSAQGNHNTFALAYTKQPFLDAYPDIAERYLQALLDAEDYIKKNKTEAQALVAKDLNYSQEYVEYMWTKINFHIALDQELLIGMENQANWLIRNNLTKAIEVPNYLDYIYFPALNKINPAVITMPH